jgi:TolB-like protein
MTEELTTTLSKIEGLRVISRTSAMRYKQVHKPLPQIAKELGVGAIITGSVLRSGGKVRVNTQLIEAPEDKTIWADSYERELGDILVLQREISGRNHETGKWPFSTSTFAIRRHASR